MANEFDLDELEAELSDFAASGKKTGRTPREERIIAGFEDIQRFVEEHGHAPRHGDDKDIFERLYAVRLDRLRDQEECRTLLMPLDHQGLLNAFEVREPQGDYTMTDDELLAELAGDDEGRIFRTYVMFAAMPKNVRPRRLHNASVARTLSGSSRCLSKCSASCSRAFELPAPSSGMRALRKASSSFSVGRRFM